MVAVFSKFCSAEPVGRSQPGFWIRLKENIALNESIALAFGGKFAEEGKPLDSDWWPQHVATGLSEGTVHATKYLLDN